MGKEKDQTSKRGVDQMSIMNDMMDAMYHAKNLDPSLDMLDSADDARAIELATDHAVHFRGFFSASHDWDSIFKPSDFNRGVDVAMLGQKLLDEYRASYEEYIGGDWEDA